MKIIVNNEAVEVSIDSTLAAVMDTLNIPTGCGGMAVAVNDEMVPRTSWADYKLSDGDNVLVIRAAYGG